ncbi:MAG: Type I phosphodiesterase / nucleotide pyrophosphatase [uncultured Aureispira sp.]|uniref:Type I phosphodiesterase / nucleotide pyrophosphatase n=1 Tax=uncultured Aureispira sp. TaxID=1331704 RepID=A0A6S6TU73_9BACT|nr:MAG: Type I phosphodiesterase / nucleotide pyrophosphatase [uncultured Aureispira sp.]
MQQHFLSTLKGIGSLFFILMSFVFNACDKTTEADCPEACANSNLQHVKKVLLIGIDGCRSDALQAANTPNLDQLIANSRYSWTLDRGNTDTWSGAGWSTMLTGVWPAKHGVKDNWYVGKNYGEYPHFLCRVKETSDCFKTASIVHYTAINDEIVAPCNTDELRDYDKDANVTEAVTNYLNDCNMDVIFAHFDGVDHAGHSRGFHPSIPEYIDAIETVDADLKPILDAVYEREANHNEDWLIIVSTDHGGTIEGAHGGEDNNVDVTRVFGIFRTKNTANPGGLRYSPELVDVVPTIFNHLGIPINSTWNLDGVGVAL